MPTAARVVGGTMRAGTARAKGQKSQPAHIRLLSRNATRSSYHRDSPIRNPSGRRTVATKLCEFTTRAIAFEFINDNFRRAPITQDEAANAWTEN